MELCEFVDCQECKKRHESVFAALSPNDLHELNEAKTCYRFSKGEAVFNEGSYPRGLYCVLEGKLKVVRMSPEGKEQIVHLAKSGDAMGYRALLSNEKYSCSGIAIETSRLCHIPKSVFLNLVEKSPKLAKEMLRMFSVELRIAEKNITDLALLPVRQRITQALILLKERYGFKEDNCTINIVLSREEIANLSGTTRETAIRVLSDLSDRNVIEMKAKAIKILNYKKLVEMAEIYD